MHDSLDDFEYGRCAASFSLFPGWLQRLTDRTLFVKNISATLAATGKVQIRAAFQMFGTVESLTVREEQGAPLKTGTQGGSQCHLADLVS